MLIALDRGCERSRLDSKHILADRAETSFITDSMGNITPEQWHAGSKIGELEITQLGKLSVAGQQLAPTRKHPDGRGRALAKVGRRGPRLSRRERIVRAMSKIAAPAE